MGGRKVQNRENERKESGREKWLRNTVKEEKCVCVCVCGKWKKGKKNKKEKLKEKYWKKNKIAVWMRERHDRKKNKYGKNKTWKENRKETGKEEKSWTNK